MSNSRKPIGEGVSKKGVRYPIYESLGETFSKPSLTVPDLSIPLKHLILRYRRDGTELLQGVYHNDDTTLPPEFDRMEKTDRIDFARLNAERIHATRSALDKRTAAQKEKDAKRAFDDAVAAKLDELKEVK